MLMAVDCSRSAVLMASMPKIRRLLGLGVS